MAFPPRPTMNDVARQAGVSRKTVSRLVNGSAPVGEPTRTRILAAMGELGFGSPAVLETSDTPTMESLILLHDGSDPELAMVVEATLRDLAGVSVFLLRMPLRTPGDDPAGRLRRFLVRHHPGGVILLPPLSHREALPTLCAEAGIRCVRLGYADLACDDRAAMAHLVRWLAAEGHVRVGFISHGDSSPSGRLREEGYLEGMKHDLRNGPLLIVPGNGSFASGVAAAQILLDLSPRPSAIVASNDEMAAGVLQAAAQAGLSVPHELSVIGFEDMPIAAKASPPLTTMRVPWQEIATEALSRLVEGQASRHTFAADLVLRESFRSLAQPAEAAPLTLAARAWKGLRA